MTKRVDFLSSREAAGRGDGLSIVVAGRSGTRTGTWELVIGLISFAKLESKKAPSKKNLDHFITSRDRRIPVLESRFEKPVASGDDRVRMTESLPHVVIVGAGFGGLEAARGLAHASVRVTVIDRRNHYLFQPLLYQVATAALSPADIAYPIRSILRRQKNADVVLAEVVSIDPARREIALRDGGTMTYDTLVVASGARHAYFGHEDWASQAPGLKNLEDALEIRRRILLAYEEADREPDAGRRKTLLTFVIVGGGPTGVELAGAIAEIARQVLVDDFRHVDPRETRVILIEAGPRILPSYAERSSASAADELRHLGVEVRTGEAVTAVDGTGVVAGGRRFDAATVLWAAGVAASRVGTFLGAPLDRNGRVVVEPDLTVPGRPEIFVIGDLALFTHQGGKPLPGVSPVAMQQGRHVARAIRDRLASRTPRPFHYLDKGSMAVVGRSAAIAEVFGLKLRGFPAWLAWSMLHIFYLIGFRNRFVVMFEWAWAYFSYQRGARLITGNLETPVRAASAAAGKR
jgi:NADH dehydrogenase